MDNVKLNHTSHSYPTKPEATDLNTIDIWLPKSKSPSNEDRKTWVIYIHGGAWRDPEVDSRSFEPAVEVLWNSPLKNVVAGFASINYRLSPYPTHSNNPSSPNDPARNVHYPDHLVDVAHALIYLEDNFHIEDRYILAGHSAGATMAFELHNCYINDELLPKPSCVLGIAGIYNFEAFLEAHKGISAYKELMDNAFPDRGVWKEASPYHSHFPGLANWEHAKTVVISHSDQDELVEKAQAGFMLERVRMTPHSEGKIHFLQASGAHDEIWQSGHILADLISKSLQLGYLFPPMEGLKSELAKVSKAMNGARIR